MPQSHQPPLGIEPATHLDIADHDRCGFIRDWQRHVLAGRVGGNPPTPPAILAQPCPEHRRRIEANDALFRGFARDRRRLGR